MLKVIKFPIYLLLIILNIIGLVGNAIYHLVKITIYLSIIGTLLYLFYIFINDSISNHNLLIVLVLLMAILLIFAILYIYSDDFIDAKVAYTKTNNELIENIKSNFKLAYSTILPFSILGCIGFGIVYTFQSSNNSYNNNSSRSNFTNTSSYNSNNSYDDDDGYNEDGYNEDGYNEDGYDENGNNEDGNENSDISSLSCDDLMYLVIIMDIGYNP